MMCIYSNGQWLRLEWLEGVCCVRNRACDTEAAEEEWVVSMVEKCLEEIVDNGLVDIAKVDAIYA